MVHLPDSSSVFLSAIDRKLLKSGKPLPKCRKLIDRETWRVDVFRFALYRFLWSPFVSKCLYAGVCSGCIWIGEEYQTQLAKKKALLAQASASVGYKEVPDLIPTRSDRSRDRVDLKFEKIGTDLKVGLFDLHRQLLDLASCPQMSSDLESFYLEFRDWLKKIPTDFGSVRLRVGPGGTRGVWFDLPNLSIKALLEEKDWLLGILDREIVIEIGQRRKRVFKREGRELHSPLQLRDQADCMSEAQAWSSSFVAGFDSNVGLSAAQQDEKLNESGRRENFLREVPLLSAVGGFTQPGRHVNRTLVERVLHCATQSDTKDWMEIGCGIGNLTFPLASIGIKVRAFDLDELALRFAIENKRRISRILGRTLDVEFKRGNFSSLIPEGQGLLVDPPRSGLGALVSAIGATPVKEILYVSCHSESWARDVEALRQQGFSLIRLEGVDLFPSTPHFEIVSLLRRKS